LRRISTKTDKDALVPCPSNITGNKTLQVRLQCNKLHCCKSQQAGQLLNCKYGKAFTVVEKLPETVDRPTSLTIPARAKYSLWLLA
jgi:hypothetical protein